MSSKILKSFDSQLRSKIMQKNSGNQSETKFLQKTFKFFDIQNRGKVNFDQFFRAMEKAGIVMSRPDLHQVFEHFDINGDEDMDYKEFSNMFFDQNQQEASYQDPYLREKARREALAAAVRGDNPESLLNLFRDKLKGRGARGMIGLQRLFKMMDDDESQSLSLPEFSKACRDFKVGISDENVPILFSVFDTNGDGTLNYAEFVSAVREPFSNNRRELVENVFHAIDVDNNGKLDLEEIKAKYDVMKHPDVIQGKRTAEAVLCEFIETIEAHHNIMNGTETDGMVSVEEFVEYYTNIGSSIDSDSEFNALVRNTWGVKDASFGSSKSNNSRREMPAAGKKEPQQPPAEFRQLHEEKPVQRSGMQSRENPLYNTQQFYGDKMTASRGNVTSSHMFSTPSFQRPGGGGGSLMPGQPAAGQKSSVAST